VSGKSRFTRLTTKWVASVYSSPACLTGRVSHGVVYVVADHTTTFVRMWKLSLTATGETPSDARCCPNIPPEICTTLTPVIDRTCGSNGMLYAMGMA
jgi:hypothetical protein